VGPVELLVVVFRLQPLEVLLHGRLSHDFAVVDCAAQQRVRILPLFLLQEWLRLFLNQLVG